MIPIESVAPV